MIKEIFCDKFKKQQVPFKDGLNVVLGDDSGANSIGKSTMLLVIDYMLGGKHYQTKSDIIGHVGHHTIFVCFEFDGEKFYFARKTEQSDTVFKSSPDYKILDGKEMTLLQYRKFLQDKYELNIYGCTLRTFIGLFARIYDRGNYMETLPLLEHHGDSSENSIKRLVKIFGVYEDVGTLDLNLKNLKERNDLFKKALAIDLIKGPKNKKELKNNEGQINSLQQEIDILTLELANREVSLGTLQLKKVLEIKEELAKFQTLKNKNDSKIRRIQNNLNSTKTVSIIDLEKLKKFFPEANFLEITKINNFHSTLCTALSDEMTNKIKSLEMLNKQLESEVKKLLQSIENVVSETNSTKIGVQQLAQMQRQMYELITENSTYEKKTSFVKEKKDAEDLYNDTLQKILTSVQQVMNTKILEYNGIVYNNTKKAPQLTLQPKKYIYDCPDDEGTGSRYSGLVLFDLAVLGCTKLPVLFHDSLILKNIEDNAIEKIMQLYDSFSNKQIFIAFDKKTAYTEDTQKIVDKNIVLKLSPNGHELFGKSWSRLS